MGPKRELFDLIRAFQRPKCNREHEMSDDQKVTFGLSDTKRFVSMLILLGNHSLI